VRVYIEVTAPETLNKTRIQILEAVKATAG
jgi:hypothetical protein